MSFGQFMQTNAVIDKIELDRTGSEKSTSSSSAKIDVQYGQKRVIDGNREAVEVVGKVFIEGKIDIDVNHNYYKIKFNNQQKKLHQIRRFYHIGSTTVSHYEAMLV